MSKVKNDKNEVWKSVRLTSFQKPQLQSVSIFSKFVHPCLPLYYLCYLYVILKFRAVIFMFNPILWQFCLNFDKLRDTAPSKSSQNWLTPILKVEFHISYFFYFHYCYRYLKDIKSEWECFLSQQKAILAWQIEWLRQILPTDWSLQFL